MRIRTLFAALVVGALAALVSVPALAQTVDVPDLPGMDRDTNPARRLLDDNDDRRAVDVPAAGTLGGAAGGATGEALPAADRPSGNVRDFGKAGEAADTKPAASTRRASSGKSLPRTGGAIAGYGLLGLALVFGGRLLLEFAPRRV